MSGRVFRHAASQPAHPSCFIMSWTSKSLLFLSTESKESRLSKSAFIALFQNDIRLG